MPTYDYKCSVCGKVFEQASTIELRDYQYHCMQVAKRLITFKGNVYRPTTPAKGK